MIDPTFTVGLQSLDFGSVYSSDGREHPLLALTPIFATSQSAPQRTSSTDPATTQLGSGSFTDDPTKPRSGGSDPVYAPDPADPSSVGNAVGMGSLNPFHFPPHFGARVAVSVIAIAILLIVVARLLLK